MAMTATNTDEPAVREHLLLTVLGTAPQDARYTLHDKEVSARLAPKALLDLLPGTSCPDRVLALCTVEAERDSWPLLEEALAGQCPPDRVEIRSGSAQADVETFLATLTEAVPEGADLTVDITHGLRHFSFLTYVGVLYLAALRGVAIRGAYYGLWRPKPEPSPFFDLRPLLELPRWFHALQVLRETGSALPMAGLLDDGSSSPSNQSARTCARDLKYLSAAYLSGLPLELGWQARKFREQRRRPLRRLLQEHGLPLEQKLLDLLDGVLQPLALTRTVSGDGWKLRVGLTEEELRRQACVIDDLLRRESYATAFGLMSEWTVSWVAWVRGNGVQDWLNFSTIRRSASTVLAAIAAAYTDFLLHDALTEEQRALASFWRQLTELRNGYAHHGMRPQPLVGDRRAHSTQRNVVRYWTSLKALPTFRLSLGESSGGRILVSPIGKRPGVLFSALHACQAVGDSREPELSLVICSHDTQELIGDVLQHAAYAGKVEPLLLADAFAGGPQEIERLAHAARRHLLGAEEVLVNVTGGTTLMGLAAERIAGEARALACPVRRFGLIDRRPPSEQDADPYRTGEPFWLDAREDDDH
ncbi:MAG: CRISPR-associated DxTHG motif protein [Spirochaetaceae bacterium]|nr:CRISPR-associated DxTHG motif protein [Spirochaetaceae bacterium]